MSKYEPDPELVAKRAIGKEGFTRFQTTRMIVMMTSRMVEIYNDGDHQMLTIVYIILQVVSFAHGNNVIY